MDHALRSLLFRVHNSWMYVSHNFQRSYSLTLYIKSHGKDDSKKETDEDYHGNLPNHSSFPSFTNSWGMESRN